MSDPKAPLKRPSPHHFKRYKHFCVDVQHRGIPAAWMTDTLAPVPEYLPQDWTPYIHPEGAIYYHRNSQSGLKVVTTAKHSSAGGRRLEGIEYWRKEIGEKLVKIPVKVSDLHELCLEYDGDEDSWEDIGVATTFSEHLPYSSRQATDWKKRIGLHVGYYPSHPGIPTEGVVDNFLRMLTHAQGDGLTSFDITFCYCPGKCAQFTKLVKPYRKLPIDGRVLCIVTRLNSHVATYKLMNHFGQPHSRLSREISILNAKPRSTHRLSSTLSRILFGVSASFLNRSECPIVDDMVYDEQFQEFCANCQEDTRRFFNLSFSAIKTR